MHTTVYEIFQDTAKTFSVQPFLHIPHQATKAYSDSAIDLSYAETLDRIDKARAAYTKPGIGVGARVGLILDNRADFFIHWIALNALGASIVPLNNESTPKDLAHIVDDSGLLFIVALDDRLTLAYNIIKVAKRTVPVISANELQELPDFGPLGAELPSTRSECALLYTSGSTGKPKGCMLSNEYFIVMGDWYRELGGLCAINGCKDRLLTALPLVHMNALACSTMCIIMTGGCLIQLDRFHPRNWWETVKDSGATVLHYLGVQPAILLNLSPSHVERVHNVRFGFGAGVNPKHQKPFEARFGFPLIEAWSMTEVGGGAAIIANHEPRHVGTCCFGKPESFMEWRLVNDAEKDVERGQPGEMLVRRAGSDARRGFFSGYFGMYQETEKSWANGWFHTGDVVYEGHDGSLHFVDRKKSIVRRSGENISSLEVEAVLSQFPGIKAVGVAPVPDDIRGEEVFAVLVQDSSAAQDRERAEAIFTAALRDLSYFKVPGYIAFMDVLPLTASHKLRRDQLKMLARTTLEKGEVFDLCDLKRRPRKV